MYQHFKRISEQNWNNQKLCIKYCYTPSPIVGGWQSFLIIYRYVLLDSFYRIHSFPTGFIYLGPDLLLSRNKGICLTLKICMIYLIDSTHPVPSFRTFLNCRPHMSGCPLRRYIKGSQGRSEKLVEGMYLAITVDYAILIHVGVGPPPSPSPHPSTPWRRLTILKIAMYSNFAQLFVERCSYC